MLENDAKILATRKRHIEWRDFGLRSANGYGCITMILGYDHLPMTRGNRKKRSGALRLGAPNPFYKRRVRKSFLKAKDHSSTSAWLEFTNSIRSEPVKGLEWTDGSGRTPLDHIAP